MNKSKASQRRGWRRFAIDAGLAISSALVLVPLLGPPGAQAVRGERVRQPDRPAQIARDSGCPTTFCAEIRGNGTLLDPEPIAISFEIAVRVAED